jgi:hypothetical protein
MKPPEPMEADHGGSQYPHRVVAPVKKKKQIYLYVHHIEKLLNE